MRKPLIPCLALLGAVSGSCANTPSEHTALAPPERAAPAPPVLAVDIEAITSRRGFVYRQAYFTAAEVLDPAWEAARRRKMDQIQMCLSYRIIRRDIRWYEPTPQSGRRCAAIVYTGLCREPGWGRLGLERFETDRIDLLRQDADRPIPENCGTKDPATTPETVRPTIAQQRAGQLSPAARCEAGEEETSDPIQVVPETRLYARTLVSPAFAVASPAPFRADIFARMGALRVGVAFRDADRIGPRERSTPLADDGVNILITQEFALRPNGQPYCVQLTARQGQRRWRRTIERAGFVEHLRREVGVGRRSGLSNDPSRYWSPSIDGMLLGDALGTYLLAHAAPDREFRREWGR